MWLEPAGVPGGGTVPSAISMSLVIDLQAETARITNTGTDPTNLTGWKLVSTRGNQVFDQFPDGFTLNAGESVTVTAGPTANAGTGFLRWTDQNIWNNSGDPGQLIDNDGHIVAETN